MEKSKMDCKVEYTDESRIETVDDVRAFFRHVVLERRVNFHPDDGFGQYVDTQTGRATFTEEEVALYDRLLAESFKVCWDAGEDIYLIGCEVLKEALRPRG